MSCNQMASTSNDAGMSSVLNENAVMNIEGISSSQKYFDRHIVRAAGLLERDSSTIVVDVSELSQKSTSIMQYVEIDNANGYLFCVNGPMSTACWLKVVSFANDCHSYNVLLMLTIDGVIMKTIRNIDLGEELLMWFDDDILAMLNISFLRPYNIQGYNRYVCHICNKWFEFPNPLKVHIALNCDQLDIDHFWIELENEFNLMMMMEADNTQMEANDDYLYEEELEIIISNIGRSRLGYSCFYCGKVYSNKNNLRIHVRVHTGYKPLKCVYCEESFGDPKDLNRHIRLHLTNKTSHTCQLCMLIFAKKQDLERHIKLEHQGNVDHNSDSSSEVIDVEPDT